MRTEDYEVNLSDDEMNNLGEKIRTGEFFDQVYEMKKMSIMLPRHTIFSSKTIQDQSNPNSLSSDKKK